MSVTGPGNQAHGEEINYKEAIAILNIRLDDLDSDRFATTWTIRQNQQNIISNMTYSMFGEEKRSVTPRLTKDNMD